MTMSPGLPPSSRALETEKGLLRGLVQQEQQIADMEWHLGTLAEMGDDTPEMYQMLQDARQQYEQAKAAVERRIMQLTQIRDTSG